MTLFEQNPEAWQAIREMGRPNLYRMSKLVYSATEMEDALCYGHGVVIKWVEGRNKASKESDRRAAAWLQIQKREDKPEAPAPAESKMLLIACPAGVAPKIEHIAAMLGCDVTDI